MSKFRKDRHTDGQRTSIGDKFVDDACLVLNKTALRECSLYLDCFEAKNILNWLFNEKLLDQLRQIKDVVPIGWDNESYPLSAGVWMVIGFQNLDVPTIRNGPWFTPDMAKCEPLIKAAKQAQEIQKKYARVKSLLRWFNRNATIGAVRAYWPAVLALCPDAPSLKELKEKPPARYATPNGIGAMLPLVRETASTVAAMGLIPAEIVARRHGDVWLQLAPSNDEFEGAPYATEGLAVNL